MSINSHSSRTSRVADLRPNSPGQLAIVGVIIWLLGVVLHPLAILVPLGLLVLAVAALGFLLRPKSQTMYWRGRRIDLEDKHASRYRLYYAIFRS
ncbi:MAG: hypothetical protein JO023_01140 [Chloroflexi bacterium]|nr:hypothetical protein [Chloroflexota bacterium]